MLISFLLFYLKIMECIAIEKNVMHVLKYLIPYTEQQFARNSNSSLSFQLQKKSII